MNKNPQNNLHARNYRHRVNKKKAEEHERLVGLKVENVSLKIELRVMREKIAVITETLEKMKNIKALSNE